MNMRRAILTCALAILGVVDGAWARHGASERSESCLRGWMFLVHAAAVRPRPGSDCNAGGYAEAGGEPTYKQVSAGETSHRESIEVTYDPAKVSYDKLLEVFWRNINPIQTDGQFHDIGDQYTTAIFYTNEEQKTAAEASKDALAKSGKFPKPIATAILPQRNSGGRRVPSEVLHQNPSAYGIYHFVSGRDSYKQRIWAANADALRSVHSSP